MRLMARYHAVVRASPTEHEASLRRRKVQTSVEKREQASHRHGSVRNRRVPVRSQSRFPTGGIHKGSRSIVYLGDGG